MLELDDMRVSVRKVWFYYVAKCTGYSSGYVGVDYCPSRCYTRSLSREMAVAHCRQKAYNRETKTTWEQA